MTRKHFEFISAVGETLLELGCVENGSIEFRYKQFEHRDIKFIVPHVQKYTYSVHIQLKDREYNFHSKELNYIKAADSFKEHIKILWQ